MSSPRLLLRTGSQFWTIEVPVRGGGWAVPVHGVDSEGFALDPHAEIPEQRERHEACDRAIKAGATLDQLGALIAKIESKHATRCATCGLTYSEHVLKRGRDCEQFAPGAKP